MTARDDWEADRERLRREYHKRWGPGRQPLTASQEAERDKDFQTYMDGARQAWRRFQEAAPGESDKIWSENMLKISELSGQ